MIGIIEDQIVENINVNLEFIYYSTKIYENNVPRYFLKFQM